MHIQFHHRGPRLLAVLALLSAVALGCGQAQERQPSPAPRFDEPLTETFGQEQAADFIGQPFPTGATGLHVTGESALDTIVIARFDAPREDVVAWLADLGITEPLEPGYSPFYSSDPLLPGTADWWAPPAAGDLGSDFSGVHQQIGAKYYNIAVRELENGMVRVHLQVYNT